jgi:DNA-binding GntR family transcriptional regulator
MATVASRLQLRKSAAAHIRELIVAGQARPGELLRLAPLAERVSTSITPIREACAVAEVAAHLKELGARGAISASRESELLPEAA